MIRTAYTKADIERMVKEAIEQGKGCIFEEDDLIFAFGFKRIDGEEYSWRKIFSSKTEEQMSTLSPAEMRRNFQDWCRERNWACVMELQEAKWKVWLQKPNDWIS